MTREQNQAVLKALWSSIDRDDFVGMYGDTTEPVPSGAWQWSGCTASGEQHHSYVEIWHYQRREPGEQRCTAEAGI